MNATLNKPALWSFAQAAPILGLHSKNGRYVVGQLVHAHALTPKRMGAGRPCGLDRSDLDFLAKLLNKTIDWPAAS